MLFKSKKSIEGGVSVEESVIGAVEVEKAVEGAVIVKIKRRSSYR